MSGNLPQINYYFQLHFAVVYVGSPAFQEVVKRHDAEGTFKPIELLKGLCGPAAARARAAAYSKKTRMVF